MVQLCAVGGIYHAVCHISYLCRQLYLREFFCGQSGTDKQHNGARPWICVEDFRITCCSGSHCGILDHTRCVRADQKEICGEREHMPDHGVRCGAGSSYGRYIPAGCVCPGLYTSAECG